MPARPRSVPSECQSVVTCQVVQPMQGPIFVTAIETALSSDVTHVGLDAADEESRLPVVAALQAKDRRTGQVCLPAYGREQVSSADSGKCGIVVTQVA